MDLGLKRRRAVVTGASRGIGRAIASALAAEGADVVAAARNAQKLKELAASVAGGTGTITAHAADMSQADAIQGLAGELEKADILVFNTGGPPFGTAAEITDASWTAQFEAMFLSAIRLTRLALPGMRQRRFGRIMLVVSSGVIQPIPNLALSNALRSGLVGWAKTLASEVAADGVTVNCLAPGRIATDRIVEFDEARARREGITVEQAQKASTATIPAGRYGEADEFAAMAAFLASPRASYMTGGIIRIDGGMIRSV
ncbi:MAG: 3-oxoacyl-[acyl-carrier protein] reductase [Gammaproteobacteria bacterium]|nr:3-oxoacyl-[acyl-carrier protein] reductase [Gammaproteobacteria bacterium]